ncbi:hypothetical protein [Streptomyces luteogriseus]|uniref:hypothetical protein n=1 Tax=Streptomyces luteogriseus TaxID=68233 RepID=UPI0037875DE3
MAGLPDREPRPGARWGSADPLHGPGRGRTLGHIEIDTALARPEHHARSAGPGIRDLSVDADRPRRPRTPLRRPARHGTGPGARPPRLCVLDPLALLAGTALANSPGPAGLDKPQDCAQIPGR